MPIGAPTLIELFSFSTKLKVRGWAWAAGFANDTIYGYKVSRFEQYNVLKLSKTIIKLEAW